MTIERWVFLGGPIMQALSGNGYDSRLRSVIEATINMLETRGYRVRSALSEGYLDYGICLSEAGTTPRQQAWRDHEGVVGSACYIALWPSNDRTPLRSDGMCVEIGWATQAGVPCILIRDMAARHSDIILGLDAIGSVTHLDYSEFLKDNTKLLPVMVATLAS